MLKSQELPHSLTIENGKYGGIYTKVHELETGSCIYRPEGIIEYQEQSLVYFTIPDNSENAKEIVTFSLTITVEEEKVDIWYRKGTFWKINADKLDNEYRYKLENQYINHKIIYDQIAQQFWQKLSDKVEANPEAENYPETLVNTNDSGQEITPIVKSDLAGGTTIILRKKDLPIEIIVLDSDSKLKVFRK